MDSDLAAVICVIFGFVKHCLLCSGFPATSGGSFLLKMARPATLLKKETLAQMFSCEFCEISKNAFFTEHVWATASAF